MFELKSLKQLYRMMVDSGLVEIDLTLGGDHLVLRRHAGVPSPVVEQPEAIEIRAPLAGRFSPLVELGRVVAPQSVVCTIQEGEQVSELPAGCSGRVEKILVQSGAQVKKNDGLFRISVS